MSSDPISQTINEGIRTFNLNTKKFQTIDFAEKSGVESKQDEI